MTDLDEIEFSPMNPKLHDDAGIAESINEHGLAELPMIDDRTGWLEAGHGRIASLRARRAQGLAPPDGVMVKDGRWLVPLLRGWASRDAHQAERYLIGSNQLTINGGWKTDDLAQRLTELATEEPGLLGTGYTAASLEELLASVRTTTVHEHQRELPGEDDVPEPPTDPITKRGDIWLLGPHRVMCGDSRNPTDVTRLLNGATVNLAFTSPPYADRRTYDETSGFIPVPPEEYVEWFAPVAANVAEHLAEDGSWFVNIKAGAEGLDTWLYVHDLVLAHAREWGWHYATEFCWEKRGVPVAVARRFKNAFEPVYQFTRGDWKLRPLAVQTPSDQVPTSHTPGTNAEMQGLGDPFGDRLTGMAYPSNRLPTFAGTHEALGHSAAFPVGLPAWFIRAFTDEGDTVYDPFIGSGSTLLAAHQHDRVGYGMEISPAYCDVICQRFERVTGIAPTLQPDTTTGVTSQP